MEPAFKGSVLITPRSLSRSIPPFLEKLRREGYQLLTPWPGEQPSEAQLLEVLPGCAGYLAGVERISRRVLEAASPQLKIIARNGTGIDNIDIGAAAELGITVKGTPGANSQGVAELAVSLMLDSLRSIAWSSGVLKSGAWERRRGKELAGRVLGVIGCGQIGQRMVKASLALGMEVLGSDKNQDPQLQQLEGFRFASLDEVLAGSEVISLHCPPAEDPIIGHCALQEVQRGVHIINTARAGLVDEQAMLEALNSGMVGHYSTDVFTREPPEDLSLIRHERVTATPHIGGFTEESIERSGSQAAEHILKELLQGEEGDT